MYLLTIPLYLCAWLCFLVLLGGVGEISGWRERENVVVGLEGWVRRLNPLGGCDSFFSGW